MEPSTTMHSELSKEIKALQLTMDRLIQQAEEDRKSWKKVEEDSRLRLAQIKSKIRLNVGGTIFSTSKTTLMRFPVTVFSVMLSTNIWTPDAYGGDGIYFFDRNAHVMDHVLDYMANGWIRTEILSPQDLKSLKDDLAYFEIPYYEDTSTKVLRAPIAVEVENQQSNPEMKYYESLRDLGEKTGKDVNLELDPEHPQQSIAVSVNAIFDQCLKLSSSLHGASFDVKHKLQKWRHLEEKVSALAAASADQIKLEFRSRMFTTCKRTLMKTPWFEAQVSRWEPDPDSGAYFIDRNPRFIDLILDFLRTGTWNTDSIDKKLLPELEEELEYFNIDESPVPLTWDPQRKTPEIVLSDDLRTATKTAGLSWNTSVIGTAPATKVRYTIIQQTKGYMMVGLAPETAMPNTRSIFLASGFYFFARNGSLYSQDGHANTSPPLGKVSAQNGEWIEFEHDRAERTIYMTRPAQARQIVFQNVPDIDLRPCVTFGDNGSVRIE
eukprot:TRINITY_DN8259_c0_g1_i1.p1 TRINITY_DN8259_c0_g1~~TRINITY_DN8259_c0_g1_i1.p1  ORF type:complete len:493 (+),score=84.03 TRINITY_DN8259_c0_g1_i1:108-1586(+)